MFDLTEGDTKRVIVVGAGPVGVRFTNELLNTYSDTHIHLFGNEPYKPYDRVQLSAVLAGNKSNSDIDLSLPEESHNFKYSVSRINAIDTFEKTVLDSHGNYHKYDYLVLALGARSFVPNIPNVDKKGVYTFRNMKDTEFLYSRVSSARHVTVVGGGLLGIEAAKGLRRLNTKVTLVQQAPHLMNRQLDSYGAAVLREKIEALGIDVIVNSGVREIIGDDRVEGVKLLGGKLIDCDTVLLCTGIQANVELAREAGLTVRKGIVVDDELQCSQNDVFAIGECTEHSGITYGLVSPGYEQAAIVANNLAQTIRHENDIDGELGSKDDLTRSQYSGSLTASRLKVLDEKVFSVGDVSDTSSTYFSKTFSFKDKKSGVYRKIKTYKGEITGAMAIGEWAETNRIQEAFRSKKKIRFWQRWLFPLSGKLWSSDDESVISWSDTAVVCQCNNITKKDILHAIDTVPNCQTVKFLQGHTSAGTVCGSCVPLLEQFFSEPQVNDGVKGKIGLLISAALALLMIALFILIPASTTSDSVLTISWFEKIWSDKFFKKLTGFTLSGITALGLVMSLRKRLNLKFIGEFALWRLVHVFVGVAGVALLMFHTGFHMGENLNRLLLINFLGAIFLGFIAATILGSSHKLSSSRARTQIKYWNFLHTLITWPLPVLIVVHIASVYYF